MAYDSLVSYYSSQAGLGSGVGGSITPFSGPRFQRGYGWGSFFSSLFRSATPVLRRGLLTAGRELLKTGAVVADDVINGRSIKDSAHERFSHIVQDLAGRAVLSLRKQLGGTLIYKRRRRRGRTNPITKAKHRKRKRVTRKKTVVKGQTSKKRKKTRRRRKSTTSRGRRTKTERSKRDIFD
jgi:hypothetical protein